MWMDSDTITGKDGSSQFFILETPPLSPERNIFIDSMQAASFFGPLFQNNNINELASIGLTNGAENYFSVPDASAEMGISPLYVCTPCPPFNYTSQY